MDKKFFKIKSLLFWLVMIFGFVFLQSMQQKISYPQLSVDAQVRRINLESEFLKIFHLGQKRLISSFMWVETLLRADEKHYHKDDLNSWMFHRFNNIVTLDPKFYEAYLYGGQYLAIIKDDPQAAEVILDKGIEKYPDVFQLRLFKAYNSLFELDDREEALVHYKSLIKHPKAHNSPIVFSIYSRLQAKEGQTDHAYNILNHMYETTESKKLKKVLEKELEKLSNKKPLDKEGLEK